MPRFPEVSDTVAAMRGSVYSALAHRLASFDGEVYPFHIGDTWMEPAIGCRMQDIAVEDFPGMHRYAMVQGRSGLIDAIVSRTRERTGAPTERADVLVTAGATGGLGALVGGLVSPGDEVLILAPYWPLIAGITRTFHGIPVPVPFVGEVDGPETAVEAVEARRSERTVALYINTPNNPTGRIIERPVLEALVSWARSHDLWVISDEVYEDYAYASEHSYTRPLAPERVFSCHSFSKAFGMAGNRAGYIVGPTEVMHQVRKVGVHTYYSTPTAAQIAAQHALEGLADEWVADAARLYQEIGRHAAERLGAEPPQGSTFVWLDVADRLDERGLGGFLEDCVDRGLFIAPGPSFGPYPTHVRMCFTATPPDVTRRGIEVLRDLIV